MARSYRRLKAGCYATGGSMAIIANLAPVLFLTFRSLYGISYSLLGLLVVVNFSTQLAIDLAFSFFSHKFNIPLAVKLTPALAAGGLVLFAAAPVLFSANVYVGLLIGTVIFSAAGGLAEVLMSPVIAAIPADDPDRELSKLHSFYAWGTVAVIIICTLFLLFLDAEHWPFLPFFFALVPLSAFLLLLGTQVPQMERPERTSGALQLLRDRGIWLCLVAIFLGGAAECTMSQWASGYLEMALGLPKVLGDLFGVALFGVMLGLGRTLYAKHGRNLERVLFLSTVATLACYLVAALSPIAVVGLIACALTGFCTAMLWPGTLTVAAQRFPTAGVFIFAAMAAGGDLGASLGSQLVGVITDAISNSERGIALALRMGLYPDQLGMKLGMLVGALFPLAAIAVYWVVLKTANAHKEKQEKAHQTPSPT